MTTTALIYLLHRHGQSGIYVHTAASPDEWPEALRAALDTPEARREWANPDELRRIILGHLLDTLRARNWDGGTDIIATGTQYPITICDMPRRLVAASYPGEETQPYRWRAGTTFTNFADQPRAGHMLDPRAVSIKPRCSLG